MKKCFISYKTRIAIYLIFLAHVIVSAEKSNITLNEEDEKAFFSRLRNSINDNSDSSEEVDDEDGTHRSKPRVTLFGESLVTHHLEDAEEHLKEDLEDYLGQTKYNFSNFVHYKAFMTAQMHPLVEFYTVRAKRCREDDSKHCHFKYMLVPRVGTGNVAYIIHFKIIDDAKKLKSEAKAGLKSMIKRKVGSDIPKKFPNVDKHIKIMIVFCGSDVSVAFSKKK